MPERRLSSLGTTAKTIINGWLIWQVRLISNDLNWRCAETNAAHNTCKHGLCRETADPKHLSNAGRHTTNMAQHIQDQSKEGAWPDMPLDACQTRYRYQH